MSKRGIIIGDYVHNVDFMGINRYGIVQEVRTAVPRFSMDAAWVEWEDGMPTWVAFLHLNRIDPLTLLAMQA